LSSERAKFKKQAFCSTYLWDGWFDQGLSDIQVEQEWQNISAEFLDWAVAPDHDANVDFRLFGEDGAYRKELRKDWSMLRHVHLSPETDPAELAIWNKKFDKEQKRTSDACLIYAHDKTYGFFLIAIVLSPGGHDFPHLFPKTMQLFADAAAGFIFNGQRSI